MKSSVNQSSTILLASENQAISRSDRAAVDLGLRMSTGTVAACCLSEDQIAMQYALAAGVNEIVGLDGLQTGLICCGIDGGVFANEIFLAKLALRFQAELIFDVLSAERRQHQIIVIRDLGRGVREQLRLPLPVILAISSQAPITTYVSRYRQISANVLQAVTDDRVSRDSSTISDQPIDWQPIRNRPKTVQVAAKTQGSAQSRMEDLFGLSSLNQTTSNDSPEKKNSDRNVISADPEVAADHLIRYLIHGGFLDRNRFSSEYSEAGTIDNNRSALIDSEQDSIHHPPSLAMASDIALEQTATSIKIGRGPRPFSHDSAVDSHRINRQLARRPRSYVT